MNKLKKTVQPEIEWLNLPMIRTAYIKEKFRYRMRELKPLQKDFGFWKKLNKNSSRVFTSEELAILAEIKETVKNGIKNGKLTYIFDSHFIKEYLTPALAQVNDYGEFGRARSLNYNTITAGFNKDKHSPFIAKGYEIAIKKFKKITLK